jgi:hypothetical protein
VAAMPRVNNKGQAFAYIDGLDYSQPLTLEAELVSKARSVPQNSKAHVWYNQIDKQLNTPIGDTKCHCKLYYGVPILRAEDETFAQSYDALIKNRFTVEEKLELMRWFPVTSLMSKAQKTRYMETIQTIYAQHFGIILD